MEKIVNQICDFVAYVDSFYNEKTGLYPIKGMTNSMVINAVKKHIEKVGQEFCADSVDREWVRDIILKDNNLKWGV
tara:strand:- start:77 stop:304 length:228 start_codon:yes stop_codon:yes gene_type:complete